MAFKLEKLKLDLELNLTAYIPGENGIINPVKTSPEALFAWMKLCTKIGDEVTEMSNDNTIPGDQKVEKTREKLIQQIDFLYEKGNSYWKAIPYTLLTKIVEYIREEVSATEKKS